MEDAEKEEVAIYQLTHTIYELEARERLYGCGYGF